MRPERRLSGRNGGAAPAAPEASHSGLKAINPRGLGTASPRDLLPLIPPLLTSLRAAISTAGGVQTSSGIQADLLSRFSYIVGIVIFAFVIYIGIFIEPPRDANQVRQLHGYVKIRKLMAALERYKADCGRYPTLAEGLDALVHSPGTAGWKGPYFDGEVPRDPWGRAFEYRPDNLQPEIVSYGVDGKPGGQLSDMDISSRNLWVLSPQSPTTIRARRIMIAVWVGAWVGLLGCVSLLWMNRRRSRRQLPR